MIKQSLAFLLSAAALSLASCGCDAVPTDSNTENLQVTDQATTQRTREESYTHHYLCSPAPNDLTKAILDKFENDPEKVRNAAANTWKIQKYHLLTASGDEQGAQAVLKDMFITHGVACRDFEPSLADYQERGQRLLAPPVHDWREVYDLFDKAGDIQGQAKALDLAVKFMMEHSWCSTESHELADLLGFCKDHQDIACETIVIKTYFVIHSRLADAEKVITGLGHNPTSWLYEARGDYWLASNDVMALSTAFEAYQKAGSVAKVNEILTRIQDKGQDRSVLDLKMEADAHLFLGEQATARRYAEQSFIQNSLRGDGGFLKRHGIEVTPDLLQRNGEYALSHSNFHTAFEAFTQAGYADGVQRTLDSMTAAPKSE